MEQSTFTFMFTFNNAINQQGSKFGQNLGSTKNVENDIGNHPQALISYLKTCMY